MPVILHNETSLESYAEPVRRGMLARAAGRIGWGWQCLLVVFAAGSIIGSAIAMMENPYRGSAGESAWTLAWLVVGIAGLRGAVGLSRRLYSGALVSSLGEVRSSAERESAVPTDSLLRELVGLVQNPAVSALLLCALGLHAAAVVTSVEGSSLVGGLGVGVVLAGAFAVSLGWWWRWGGGAGRNRGSGGL